MSEDLGGLLKQIYVGPGPYRAAILWIVIIILILAGITLFNRLSLLIAVGSVCLAIEAALILYGYRYRRDITKVSVYEHGMLLHTGNEKQRILWNDIEAVQTSEYVDSVKQYISEATPFILPLPGLILFGVLRESGWRTSHTTQARYVFHTDTGASYTVSSSDPRVFSLMPYIKDKVLKRVIPETVQRFKDGAEIPLLPGATYSERGIYGQFARKRRRSQQIVRLNIAWDQIEKIYYISGTMRIKAKKHETVSLPLGEIFNRGAFITVLKTLNKAGRTPRIEG
jgi:hypothetical protein